MAKKTNPVQQVASTVPLVPLPCKSPQCKICNDERADDILRDKLCKATDVALAQKYYPNDTPHTIENALSVHWNNHVPWEDAANLMPLVRGRRSEEHTSELQSLTNLVCRLLLEKKK